MSTEHPRSVKAEILPLKRDHRGSVCEPLSESDLQSQRNVHLAMTLPGCVRGNHHHLAASEIFIVTGPALVRLREAGTVRDHAIPEGETWKFSIPPGVGHAIQNTGNRPCMLLAFSTHLHDPQHPDLVRDSLIET